MTEPRNTPASRPDAPPPFWARWSRIYLFVAGLLLAQTIAFYLLTRWAA